ncbi:hypothetical protein ASC94_09300 [Massilia sp. Root418]|uniref:DUF29 domain-containing protein n=1 Tax=Massilia sp. Root418 TaxID=1736532 RepID=UPI0006FF316D|nr:DUF29 domain-containing protein [Massilia sp. Root418]KQW96993.1 hypothetical protein ASC94_09300 [Massilia sp. Root418]
MLDFKNDAVPAYEDDFILWLESQAAFLRAGRLESLDRENLVDELASMANRDRRKLNHRLEVLIAHLLKCQFQPDHKTHSWENTVYEQRQQIRLIIDDSPSLRSTLPEKLDARYPHALRQAARETRLPASHFPSGPPYSVEQLLDEDFLP